MHRKGMMEMLENCERTTNELFREMFVELADEETRARVRMFSDAGSSEKELEDEVKENE